MPAEPKARSTGPPADWRPLALTHLAKKSEGVQCREMVTLRGGGDPQMPSRTDGRLKPEVRTTRSHAHGSDKLELGKSP